MTFNSKQWSGLSDTLLCQYYTNIKQCNKVEFNIYPLHESHLAKRWWWKIISSIICTRWKRSSISHCWGSIYLLLCILLLKTSKNNPNAPYWIWGCHIKDKSCPSLSVRAVIRLSMQSRKREFFLKLPWYRKYRNIEQYRSYK